jgi:hypothetical protein
MTAVNLPTGYLASSSSIYSSSFADWNGFDNNTTTYFVSASVYNITTGVYNGTKSTTINSIGTYLGEWLQIQLPSAINIVSYTINTNSPNAAQRSPSTYYLLYSNDGLTWNIADTQTNYQWNASFISTFTLATPVTSKYFRIACSLVGNTGEITQRNILFITDLTFNQSTSIVVPTLLTYKTAFTNTNELVSKSYVDTLLTNLTNTGLLDASYTQYTLYFTTSATLTATTAYFPASAMINIGPVSTAVAQASTNSFTKIFKVQNPTSAVADGQRSGYVGSTAFPKIYIGSGFIWNMSFGIGDNSTNAAPTSVCQMFAGFQISTTVPAFQFTLGPNTAPSILGIGCDVGDSVLSFYSKGTTTTNVKIPTTFSCATPCDLWFNLTIYNQNNSNNVYITLAEQTTNTSVTQMYSMTGATNILNTSLLFPIYTRAMATAGGVTGAAKTLFNKFQLFLN